MLVYRPDGHLILGERSGSPGAWQFPQGGVEEGYSLEENVLREIVEELGIAPPLLSITARLKATHKYDYAITPAAAVGKNRGQSQTFWLVHFSGKDSDVHIENSCGEFMAWRWATPSEVRAIAEPIRRPGYEKPLLEFESFLKRPISD